MFIAPSVTSITDYRLLYAAGLPIYRPSAFKRKQSTIIALLLLIGNIEPNPGPSSMSVPKKKNLHINFGLMNARSAVNKAALIHDVIADFKLDLVVVTESWITSDAPNAVRFDISPNGYRVIHAHRGSSKDKHGGGNAIIHRESVNVFALNDRKYSEFESASVNVSCGQSSVTLIYRPLGQGHVSAAFCEQLSDLFDNLLVSGTQSAVI